jgi:hypothetical protein
MVGISALLEQFSLIGQSKHRFKLGIALNSLSIGFLSSFFTHSTVAK